MQLLSDPVVDMVGLEVEYSELPPNFKADERKHIEEQTKAFLAKGGEIYQAKLGESVYIEYDEEGKPGVWNATRHNYVPHKSRHFRDAPLDFKRGVS